MASVACGSLVVPYLQYTRPPSAPSLATRSSAQQEQAGLSSLYQHASNLLHNQGSCRLTIDRDTVQNVGKAALTVMITATLIFSGPAVAFKGGGPYGMEVTRGLDLSGKDFSGRTLIKQDFKASILRQANFEGAKLLGASFFDADLTGANFTDADLRSADFSLTNASKALLGLVLCSPSFKVSYSSVHVSCMLQANFTNANLEGVLVTGNTSFKGAKITAADFTDVLFRDDQRAYLCGIADG